MEKDVLQYTGLKRKFLENIPVMQAMADAHRLDIFFMLMERQKLNVKQIASRMNISRPAISHHLKILRQAGILEFVKCGTEKYYSINRQEGGPLRRLSELSASLGEHLGNEHMYGERG